MTVNRIVNGSPLINKPMLFNRIRIILERKHADVFSSAFKNIVECNEDIVCLDDETFTRIIHLIKKYINSSSSKELREGIDRTFHVFTGTTMLDFLAVCRDHYDWQTLEDWEIN